MNLSSVWSRRRKTLESPVWKKTFVSTIFKEIIWWWKRAIPQSLILPSGVNIIFVWTKALSQDIKVGWHTLYLPSFWYPIGFKIATTSGETSPSLTRWVSDVRKAREKCWSMMLSMPRNPISLHTNTQCHWLVYNSVSILTCLVYHFMYWNTSG